ncbi:hypothetical protein GCK72_021635 [Caenorhabditis remanei]|uniref:Uncharacterized protein n=1 Tax=Caenorhabditis remanei TaxID=31234 RepID=A0A6A5GIP0_CAERE|nr:hypothetical protein GCK72_021635 [Caenorhabditis remanei]KAF1755067.1 hypothetical protein GCK72_021635 [Caenorhabditis remanei]
MPTESLDQLSDLSLISDCSYHSDWDQDQVEPVFPEERKPVVRRQKNQNNGIDVIDTALIILISVILTLSVAYLGKRIPNQKTESAPTVTNTTNTTDTFNPTEYMKSLGERRMMKTSEILGDQENVARAQRVIESKGWSKLEDVPEYYWDKFVPDITRFEGVDAYLHKTKLNGTRVEETLYFHPIKFWKVDEEGRIKTSWPSLNESIFYAHNVGGCDPLTECRKGTYIFEKGDLVYHHSFTMEGGHKMFVKTVYYIPAHKIK